LGCGWHYHAWLFNLDAGVLAGLFLGAWLPAVFSALALNAVGQASFSIVNEVRRQFKEIPGLMEGKAKPDYARCVDICTRDAIKRMIAPGLITILSPVIVGFIFGPEALGGFLAGSVITGFILAVTFSNAGGAWDNAKKWIEAGAYGGKGSEAHKAAVIGDTVGDPMKDTAGPSLNIMIKLASIVALILAPLLAGFAGLI
jgi:K(+)-stimulated pyrophosphate-energized sodium pump